MTRRANCLVRCLSSSSFMISPLVKSKIQNPKSSWFPNRFEQLLNNMVRTDAVAVGAEAGGEAVPHHGAGDVADVFGGNVDPAVEEGVGLCPQEQRLAGARPRAPG